MRERVPSYSSVIKVFASLKGRVLLSVAVLCSFSGSAGVPFWGIASCCRSMWASWWPASIANWSELPITSSSLVINGLLSKRSHLVCENRKLKRSACSVTGISVPTYLLRSYRTIRRIVRSSAESTSAIRLSKYWLKRGFPHIWFWADGILLNTCCHLRRLKWTYAPTFADGIWECYFSGISTRSLSGICLLEFQPNLA